MFFINIDDIAPCGLKLCTCTKHKGSYKMATHSNNPVLNVLQESKEHQTYFLSIITTFFYGK